MGNEILKKYSIKETPLFQTGFMGLWNVYQGIKKSTKEEVCIFIIEKKESIKEEENKNKSKKREAKLGGMTEKQLEQMKDNIKETVVNIFKSQIEKDQIKSLKKKVFSNLETPAGRSFFVSLISNNNNNISLQEDSFLFLEELIKGILNSALKSEETDQLIEEINMNYSINGNKCKEKIKEVKIWRETFYEEFYKCKTKSK